MKRQHVNSLVLNTDSPETCSFDGVMCSTLEKEGGKLYK